MAKKFNIAPVISAVSAGAGYNFAIEAIAKRVTFVNENFLVTKALAAGLIGSGMVYMAKPNDEKTKSAGYAILGVAGASTAAKLSTVLVTEEPMQGLNATARRISRKILNRGNRTPRMVPGLHAAANAAAQRPGVPSAVVPTASLNPYAAIYGNIGYSDNIYS